MAKINAINGTGNVFSDAGPAGRFLISQGPGNQPLWRTVTSPLATLNIAYDAGSGNITIDANATVDPIFQAKDASQAHTAGNIIIFTGDANVNSVAAGNAVTYSLADTINITDDVNVGRDLDVVHNATIHNNLDVIGDVDCNNLVCDGNMNLTGTSGLGFGNLNVDKSIVAGTTIAVGTTITAGTGITSTTGNIRASAGSVISNQVLTVQNGGADITGLVYLPSYNTGVLTVNNATHLVNSSNGNDGQVLRARGAGNLPVWNTLVAGAGIGIDTTNPAQITINNTGAGGNNPAFKMQQPFTGYPWGNLPTQYLGSNTPPLNILFDNTGSCFAGSPGNPARFTAPRTGLYCFELNIVGENNDTAYQPSTSVRINIGLATPTAIYDEYMVAVQYLPATSPATYIAHSTQVIMLNQFDPVVFTVLIVGGFSVVNKFGLSATTTVSGFLVS